MTSHTASDFAPSDPAYDRGFALMRTAATLAYHAATTKSAAPGPARLYAEAIGDYRVALEEFRRSPHPHAPQRIAFVEKEIARLEPLARDTQ